MKLYQTCFVYSLNLIYIIVGFLILFQCLSTFNVNKLHHKDYDEYASVLNFHKTISIKYGPKNQLKSRNFYEETSLNHSMFKKSFYEENKTIMGSNLLNLIDPSNNNSLISSKLVDYINDFKSDDDDYKKIQFYLLVYICILFNIMYLSFLLSKKMNFDHIMFYKIFLVHHFYVNVCILVINILLNSVYFALQYYKEIKTASYLHDFYRYFQMSIAYYLNNQKDNYESAYKKYMNLIDREKLSYNMIYTEGINIKINIFFLMGAIVMMVFYVFIMQWNQGYVDSENNEKFKNKDNGGELNIDNKTKLIEIEINYSNSEVANDCFEKLKINKQKKKFYNEIQILVHSIFVVYFLSIFDIVDTYRSSAFFNNNMNEINLKNNEQTFINVIELKHLEQAKINTGFRNTVAYFNEQEFSNYKRIIERKVINEFRSNENKTNNLLQTTTGTITVLFHRHSQTFGDILKICFCFLILLKIDSLEIIYELLTKNKGKSHKLLNI